MKSVSKIFGMFIVAVLLVLFAATHPGYFSNVTLMGGILLLETVLAAVWLYERWFFQILVLIFLWAGTTLPMANAASAGRWVFLGVGGFVGVVKWGGLGKKQRFLPIHLMASLCVLAALVSSMVSSRMQLSLLKSSSLFLLFLYGFSGVRVAVAGQEDRFFRGLVTACEVLTFFSGLCYIVFDFAVFGNPNSLGAIMAVAILPILTWSVMVTDERHVLHRRMVALCLAGYLLVSSVSRAGLLACAVTLAVMCFALRRGKLLLKGALVLVFLTTALGVIQPSGFNSLASSFTEQLLYKGKVEKGLLGSRKSPWQESIAVIKDSPWFGNGFGTDRIAVQISPDSAFRTIGSNSREHGSSYIALLEYVGLLGAVPFVILLLFLSFQIFRTCLWMRRTGNPQNYAIPLAMLCLAGLLHAAFEDWLFAAGYYLTLVFWVSAFLLSDFQPRAEASVPDSHMLKISPRAVVVPLFASK